MIHDAAETQRRELERRPAERYVPRKLAGRVLRCLLTWLAAAAVLAGCFPRMPANQAAQQPASTDASFSPDGSEILYAANHDGDLEIYVVNADGAGRRQLTDNDQQDFFPSWSPDGATIVFSSDRSGAVELYLMDADGGNQRPLIDGVR